MKDVGLLVLGAIIGWLGQWIFYRYQRRDEGRQPPHLVIGGTRVGDRTMAEIRNIGNDTLTEMDVKLSWLDDGHRREIVVLDFFRGSEQPQRLEVIGSGETVNADGFPRASDDGLVDVQVTGLGAKSQRLISLVRQVTVDRKEPHA